MLVMGDCIVEWLVEWLVVGMLVVGELVIDELLGELGARVFCHGKLRRWRVSGVDSHGLLVIMGNCINGVGRIDSLWNAHHGRVTLWDNWWESSSPECSLKELLVKESMCSWLECSYSY